MGDRNETERRLWGPWVTSETDAVESETQRRGQGRTVFLDSP